jgi:hypothetical protein
MKQQFNSIKQINLSAIKVKLLRWDFSKENVLTLYFEKIPTYSIRLNYYGRLMSVFTDYGYLQMRLTFKNDLKIDFETLNRYINSEDVFIEEDVSKILTFWDGQYLEKYDWISDYFIEFRDMFIVNIPLKEHEREEKRRKLIEEFDLYNSCYGKELYLENLSKFERLKIKVLNLLIQLTNYNKFYLMRQLDKMI